MTLIFVTFYENIHICLPVKTRLPIASLPDEPNTYWNAKACEEAMAWELAMNVEILAFKDNHTWELTTLPPDYTAVRKKSVNKLKIHADGTVDRYEARFVAKGFMQQEGIDYSETFSLVVFIETILAVLNTIAAHDLDIITD